MTSLGFTASHPALPEGWPAPPSPVQRKGPDPQPAVVTPTAVRQPVIGPNSAWSSPHNNQLWLSCLRATHPALPPMRKPSFPVCPSTVPHPHIPAQTDPLSRGGNRSRCPGSVSRAQGSAGPVRVVVWTLTWEGGSQPGCL